MAEQGKMIVDRAKIKKAAQTGVPLSITTYTLPHEMEMYINEVLNIFLAELNQDGLKDYLTYCVNELTTNAKKANTKRIYFREKNLDITSQSDYDIGMKTFKMDTLNNIAYYLKLQKDAGLYIKILMQVKNQKIRIEIRNNVKMEVFEYKRIHDKLVRAGQFSSLEEAFTQVLDDSEGAGLGLIIMILMLRKVGLTDENYQVLVDGEETITRILLPLDTATQQGISVLSNEIVTLVTELPQFPDNITIINRLLNDPESKLSEIALHVSNDVALTADLLKLVNSASFSLARKCNSISEAVKMVGIKGLKNLMYSLGSMQVLGNATEEQRKLWAHSSRAAFYAHNLAKNFANMKGVTDDAYVCGLLHDMGKILFSTAYPDLLESISAICTAKGISKKLFETLAGGVNHSEVGSLIAEKWNFPKTIETAIRYHHEPENAPEEAVKLVEIVYLADILCHYQDGTIDYYQIDTKILEDIGIVSEARLQKISEQLAAAYELGNQL